MNTTEQAKRAAFLGAYDKLIVGELNPKQFFDTAWNAALAAASAEEKPVAYRYRHSEGENWYYGPHPQSWWQCEPLYAAPIQPVSGAPAVPNKSAIIQAVATIAYLAGDIEDDDLCDVIKAKVRFITDELFAPSSPAVQEDDGFRGDNAALCASIDALISLNDEGALVPHGIGGHARGLLFAAANRLRASHPAPAQTGEQQ